MSNDPKKPADATESLEDSPEHGAEATDGELSEQDLAKVSGGSNIKKWNSTQYRS